MPSRRCWCWWATEPEEGLRSSTRANRWRRYPEASDPVRFTERIPFDETRGYVKNVRRNLGLYQALYGSD